MEITTFILSLLLIAAIMTLVILLAKRHGAALLIATFACAIVTTAVVGNKLIEVGPFIVSASIIIYSITFLGTDALSEFWGKKFAQKAVWAGFVADILFLTSVWLATKWTPAGIWDGNEAFLQTLGTTGRIVLASLTAYLVAQNHDVWAYHLWKKLFKGKHLWLRNNISTSTSQIIDSFIFATIAFYGIFPIAPIIVGTIVLKIVIAVFDTPFLYGIRWAARKIEPVES